MTTREPRDEAIEIEATTIYVTDPESAEAAAADGLEEESVDELVSDIEETRGEMTGTLGEIGDRLDPGHLVDQAKQNVRDATIGRVEEAVDTAGETARGVTDMVLDTIKQNPIPSAMAGIGLAWLWKNRSEGSIEQRQYGRSDSYRRSRDYGYISGDRGYGYYGDFDGSQGGIGRTVGDAAGNASQAVGEAAGTVGQTVGNTAGTVGQAVGDAAETVGQTAGDVMQRGQYAARQAGTQLGDLLESNPLALGVVALGAGAAIGMIVPESQQENEWFGEASDQVTDTVQQQASKTMEKVEQVAGTAQQAAGDEAKSQGLVD